MIALALGQLVVVTDPVRRRNEEPRTHSAKITEIKKIWLTLTEDTDAPNPRTWRMRRDTQDSGNVNYSQNNSHFYTIPQWIERQIGKETDKILRERAISVEFRSPLYGNKSFLRALADFVVQWEETHTE